MKKTVNRKLKIINVVGSRPNFVKISSLVNEIKRYKDIQSILVHTGQHYDDNLSDVFFQDLDIPEPDINLGVGSGSYAFQITETMKRFNQVCLDFKPDLVVVVGDVNATLACALSATKLGIKVAHIEAGLRSFDHSMPEEINRVITDAVSSFLFTTEESASNNLMREGIPGDRIFFVGNLMIETLIRFREQAFQSPILGQMNLIDSPHALLTLHRPSNVDDLDNLSTLIGAVREVGKEVPVLFPAHPRTRQSIERYDLLKNLKVIWGEPLPVEAPGIYLLEPLRYLDFLHLMDNSSLVLTDSGGIQEETSYLGRPCLTLRENTERPVTITHGTNRLVGRDHDLILQESFRILNENLAKSQPIKLWDEKVAQRIVNVIINNL